MKKIMTSQLATKNDIKQLEQSTKKDLKQLEQKVDKRLDGFQKFMKNEFKTQKVAMDIRMDLKFDEQKDLFNKSFSDFKSQILGAVSDGMGQVRKVDESQEILNNRTQENRQNIMNLEVRVDTLERAVIVA